MLLAILFAFVVFGTAAGVVRCAAVRDAKYYYAQLEADEYGVYLAGEGLGTWHGRGAKRFGVGPWWPVLQADLERLLEGLGPNGENLVRNVGRRNRTSAIELNFSTAKSFSALYALATEPDRARLRYIFLRAVREQLDFIQTHYGQCKRGHNGKHTERCGLTFAIYLHHVCREGTPLLHAHVVVPNLADRLDRSTGAVDFTPLYKSQRLNSVMFDVRIASALEREFGIRVLPDRFSYRVPDVPDALIRKWTPRSQQIEAELSKGTDRSARAKLKAAKKTRRRKEQYDMAERSRTWEQEAGQLGDGIRALLKHSHTRPRESRDVNAEAERAAEVVREATESLTRSGGPATKDALTIASCVRSLGRGVGANALLHAVGVALTRPVARRTEPGRQPLTGPKAKLQPHQPTLETATVSPNTSPPKGHTRSPSRPVPSPAAAPTPTPSPRTDEESHELPRRTRLAAPGTLVPPRLAPDGNAEKTKDRFWSLRKWLLTRAAAHGLVTTLGHFTRGSLVRETVRRSQSLGGMSRKEAEVAVDRFLGRPRWNGIVKAVTREGEKVWTTSRHARIERRLLRETTRLLRARGRKVKRGALTSALERLGRFGPEVAEAFSSITSKKSRLAILDTHPGERQTAILTELNRTYERSGFDVRWVTPTGAEAEDVARTLGVKPLTAQSLIARARKGSIAKRIGAFLDPRFKKLRSKLKAAEQARRPLEPLTRKSVVIVTGAGHLGTKDNKELFTLARKAGGKVVLIGDTFHAPGAGVASGLFRYLRDRGLGPALDADPNASRPELAAARHLRRHRSAAAVETLVKAGQAFCGDTLEEAVRTLLDQYREAGGLLEPHRHLIVTGTPGEANAFNRKVQRERELEGNFGLATVKVRSGPKLRSGDRVVLTRSDRKLGIRAGEAGTVISVNPIRRTVTVRRDTGGSIVVPVTKYRDITLGYAVPLGRAASVRAVNTYLLLREYQPKASHRDQRAWVFSRQALTAVLERTTGRAELFADRPADDLGKCIGNQGQKSLALSHGESVQFQKPPEQEQTLHH